jgi:hypothetical protein
MKNIKKISGYQWCLLAMTIFLIVVYSASCIGIYNSEMPPTSKEGLYLGLAIIFVGGWFAGFVLYQGLKKQ